MPIIPALITLAALAGFGSGFYAEHQIARAEIQKMEMDINAANEKARSIFLAKTAEVEAATAKAITLNDNLDKSHVAFIETTNGLDRQLDAVRLYPVHGACGGSAGAKGAAADLLRRHLN